MFTRAQFVTQVMKTWPTSNDQDLSPCFLLRTDGDGRTETRADRTRRETRPGDARGRDGWLATRWLARRRRSRREGRGSPAAGRTKYVPKPSKIEDDASHNLPKMEDERSVDGWVQQATVLADHRRAEEVGSARIGASA